MYSYYNVLTEERTVMKKIPLYIITSRIFNVLRTGAGRRRRITRVRPTMSRTRDRDDEHGDVTRDSAITTKTI